MKTLATALVLFVLTVNAWTQSTVSSLASLFNPLTDIRQAPPPRFTFKASAPQPSQVTNLTQVTLSGPLLTSNDPYWKTNTRIAREIAASLELPTRDNFWERIEMNLNQKDASGRSAQDVYSQPLWGFGKGKHKYDTCFGAGGACHYVSSVNYVSEVPARTGDTYRLFAFFRHTF